MAVEFRLLGEVEAHVAGVRLDIGHARQRCVLACLLVDVNRAVSVDALIERVWADDPPQRARNALAAYVSRLRQVLGGAEARITRGPVGYALNADSETVDLHRFRALVARARAEPEPNDAAKAWDEALALWRGEPMAGLDTPWVNEVRTALEAERLSAMLDRNDALLAVGRHTELVGDLAVALQSHPLDERLAAQLMLAQARSGRQADALDTFRGMRERLVDELGLDPGQALQDVHREVLEGVSAPADIVAPATEVVAAPPERPSGRPRVGVRRMTQFIGRAEDLRRVADALRPGAALTLTGVGGVGKTRLAFEVCTRQADDYPDGVWSCELAPLADGAAVPHALAVALGLSQGTSGGFADAVIEGLAQRRSLLVVDNCEHVLVDTAELVDRITRECPGVTVLATSREPLGIEAERLLPVAPLPAPEATELFAERARAIRPDFDLAAEPIGAVAEICRRLDGVPLAIELAAARLRVMSSLDVARRLDRLRLLSGGTRGAHPRHQSVTATIDWSYRLLAPREQGLFARLSTFAGTFDLEAAHGVCADDADDEDDTLELLTGLVDKSMVTVRSGATGTRYGLLETLRAFGRDRLRDAGVIDVYAVRHAHYFTDLFERGAAAMHGPDEALWIARMAPDAGTTFASPDYENLRTAFERAMADRDVDVALRLVASLPELMHMRVGYTSMGWVERAVEAAADAGHPIFSAAVGTAARGAWVVGQFARACELAALADGNVKPPRGHSYLGYPGDIAPDTALFAGDPAVTLAHHLREVEAARSERDVPRLVWSLYNSTVAQDSLGHTERGIDAARAALEAAEPTMNPSIRALAHCAMGRALKVTEHERALAHFDEALRLATPVQNNWLTGIARMETAAVVVAHGDPHDAARMLFDVLNHWSAAGPGAGVQHWYAFRYVSALLRRVQFDERTADALDEAARHATEAVPSSRVLTGPEALALALSTLSRYLEGL